MVLTLRVVATNRISSHWPLSSCQLQMVLPTLLARLRKGAFLLSSATSYTCLFPFLGALSIETLLMPMDNPKADGSTPFCVALLDTLWNTLARPAGGSIGGTGGSGSTGWLADVAAAHLECSYLLLLKLPPAGSSEGEAVASPASPAVGMLSDSASRMEATDSGASSFPSAVCISATTAHFARAIGSFVFDERAKAEGGGAEVEGFRSLEQGHRGWVKIARRSTVVSEVVSRALGQLHLGEEKGLGVMGSKNEASMVWGSIVEDLKKALEEK